MRDELMKRKRLLLIACAFILSTSLLLITRPSSDRFIPKTFAPKRPRPAIRPPIPPSLQNAGCRGPRGGLIDDKVTEDLPQPTYKLQNVTFPEPTYGSYDTLGLEKSWMTFEQRYGPFGYGEESSSYNFKKVNWLDVDWGKLQDQCLLSGVSEKTESNTLQSNAPPMFRLREEAGEAPSHQGKTGRQAIILRAWETYTYTPEDFWSIRSMIAEAGLATKGEYTVFLLVDVKRKDGARIHKDDDYYREVLEASVPREFWNIAVLFHYSLQESWYPKVGFVKANWQIMQPLQLFAHFYPDFDHYWQFEMDTRFSGDVGKSLQAFHKFSVDQPYKQSRERSSWTYMPPIHGSYEDLSAAVNESLKGDAKVWGPVKTGVKGFQPSGDEPPVSDPKDDDFEWGVGEDADLLLVNVLADVKRFRTDEDWVFRSWFGGVGGAAPRFMAVPAQARASRRLLESIHKVQHESGVRVPSEATLPTFAIWNGLQVVQIPYPKFQFPERPINELNAIYNGKGPESVKDGIANGPGPYQSYTINFYTRPRTFEWQSSLVNHIFEYWINDQDQHANLSRRDGVSLNGEMPNEMPSFMAEVDGKVYAPGFLMHPRKTNSNV